MVTLDVAYGKYVLNVDVVVGVVRELPAIENLRISVIVNDHIAKQLH